ncbi:MAG: AAA family ATPase [Planctomycetota bacterium]|nr:AAA family ATPase [Planctomycetota bacterium]
MRRDDGRSDLELYQPQFMDGWTMEAAAPDGEAQQSLWSLIDDRLRGRWLWVSSVGIALALLFGLLGYHSTDPTYRSTGAIHIAPRLSHTLIPIEETGQLPHYSSFLVTQTEYIRGRRVLEYALQDEDLKKLPWAKKTGVLKALEDGLEVKAGKRSELISVAFEAKDPLVAQTVCDAIIGSYFEIHGKQGGQETDQRLQVLYDLKNKYQRDLRTVRGDIQSILARHRATDLHELHAAHGRRLEEIEEKIAAGRLVLERMDARAESGEGGELIATGPALKQLEMIDPRLAELRRKRDTAIDAFEVVKSRYRRGSKQYGEAERWVATTERLFQEEYARAMDQWEKFGLEAVSSEGIEGFFEGLPPDRLREELDDLEARAAELRGDSEQLIADIQLLSEKEFEAEQIQEDLDRALERIKLLELESGSIASRIEVVQEATRPLSPHNDSRRKRAAVGIVFGFCLSGGFFFLLGTIDRRTYGAGQLRSSTAGRASTRCLGVLPDLGRSIGNAEASDVASHCVHQIRNQIEVMRDPRRGYALAVSSPFQGDGKTSIVMALGWSYAAAGYRTLLVDCDLVGRSLTRQLGVVDREGLKEALARRSLDRLIVDLPVDHLSVLPVGMDARFGPEMLRRGDLLELLEQVRDGYDIIIIDTGPLLGSLESTPVTTAADAVVLSLKRGRSRTRLEESIRRLENAGARCIGVILNAVGRSECSRYVSEASLAAAEMEREGRAGAAPSDQGGRGERNILMTAMEASSSRHRDLGEERTDAAA